MIFHKPTWDMPNHSSWKHVKENELPFDWIQQDKAITKDEYVNDER